MAAVATVAAGPRLVRLVRLALTPTTGLPTIVSFTVPVVTDDTWTRGRRPTSRGRPPTRQTACSGIAHRDTAKGGGHWGHHPSSVSPGYRPATRLERADWAPPPTALTACTVNR